MKVRTRFAPSPTGYLHVGGARTALYSWLFARHAGGQFILRVEDTDYERSFQQAVDAIMDGMSWLNLDWDEGPLFQSKRLKHYNQVIDDMLKSGIAYRCYCSKQRLESLRQQQLIRGDKPRYDGCCRYNNHDDLSRVTAPHAVRFANPSRGSVLFNDLIRGKIEVNNGELDDLIIRRSDGSPTYNFCVVVDDWDMKITHVIRGEDHINNTPRQINILKALGAPVPEYAHVSMILGNDRQKLSKRHGAVSVMQYRDEGYLPEAMLNYLLRLGWSHGDQEIFSRNEMINYFNIDSVSRSPSIFNIDKLLWLNHYYINHMPADDVARHLLWHMEKQHYDLASGPDLVAIVKLYGDRCKTLKEMAESCYYCYQDFSDFDDTVAKKYLKPTVKVVFELIYKKLDDMAACQWNRSTVYETILTVAKELNLGIGQVGMPLRVAVTGIAQSPSIDGMVTVIGKKRVLARIRRAIDYIDSH